MGFGIWSEFECQTNKALISKTANKMILKQTEFALLPQSQQEISSQTPDDSSKTTFSLKVGVYSR